MLSTLKRLTMQAIAIAIANFYLMVSSRTLNLSRLTYYYYWKKRLAHIGENTKIYGKIKIYTPEVVHVGDYSTLNDSVIIVAKKAPIYIGNNVRISTGVTILAVGLDVASGSAVPYPHLSSPVNIGDNAWLGAGSIILPNVTIGKNSIVASGAVVTKDVEENTIVAGVPAVVKRVIVN